MPSVVFTPPSSEQLAADSDPGPVWIVKFTLPPGPDFVRATSGSVTVAVHVEDWSTTTVDGTHETTVEVDRLFTVTLSVSSETPRAPVPWLVPYTTRFRSPYADGV